MYGYDTKKIIARNEALIERCVPMPLKDAYQLLNPIRDIEERLIVAEEIDRRRAEVKA